MKKDFYEPEIEALDTNQRHEMSALTAKIEKMSSWKQGVFDVLSRNQADRLTITEIQEKLVEVGFRKTIEIESVKKALDFLITKGIVLKINGDTEQFELNLLR